MLCSIPPAVPRLRSISAAPTVKAAPGGAAPSATSLAW